METNAFGAFIEMWARAFDFSGRTRRATYWEALLITIGISLLLGKFFPYADVIRAGQGTGAACEHAADAWDVRAGIDAVLGQLREEERSEPGTDGGYGD